MLYDYQYDIAAAIVTAVVFGIYMIRRSYVTKSNMIYGAILFFNFITALFDAISSFGISYPGFFSNAQNYLYRALYFFSFSIMSVLFFAYIDSKAKLPRMEKPVRIACVSLIVFYAVTILSSPWSHAVFYFDRNGKYGHGSLFLLLYLASIIMFVWELIILMSARKRFNTYQFVACICLIFVTGISLGIQLLFPNLLVCQLGVISVLFFVYVSFENPAHFTYRDTRCYNHRAFYQEIKKRNRKEKQYHLLGFTIRDYDSLRHEVGAHSMEKISMKVAETLFHQFHRSVFCMAEEKYIVLFEESESVSMAKEIVKEQFESPVRAASVSVKLDFNFCELYELDSEFDMQDINDLIEYRILHPEIEADSKKLMENVYQGKHHKEQILYIIKRAIMRDEFNVFFQPIFHWQTGRFESAEALLRLFDKDLGFINPEELVTLAEQNGYIDQIGEIVFRKVCKFIQDNDIDRMGLKYIEVNLSPLQCMREDLVETFGEIMEKYEVRPEQINLEITETAQIASGKQILSNVEAFHEMGVEFSIDDYGSGFASADYLIKLPVSIVKIDKSILWMAMKDESAMIVLQNTIKMIKDLGKEIVVEGVEDEEMVEMLGRCGCDFMQGYFYSKPISDAKFVEYIKTNLKERVTQG